MEVNRTVPVQICHTVWLGWKIWSQDHVNWSLEVKNIKPRCSNNEKRRLLTLPTP